LGINFFQSKIHCLGCRLLQRRVKRGVNAIAFRVEVLFTVFVDQLFLNKINKVRRVTSFNVLWRQLERSGLGRVSLSTSDVAGFNHGFQHKVSAVLRALWMPIRREITWPLYQTGEQSGFRQADVFEVFAKICLCRLTETSDGEGSALPHINLVGIKLKNLFLGKALLQLNGDQDFRQLASKLFFRRKKEAASHL